MNAALLITPFERKETPSLRVLWGSRCEASEAVEGATEAGVPGHGSARPTGVMARWQVLAAPPAPPAAGAGVASAVQLTQPGM